MKAGRASVLCALFMTSMGSQAHEFWLQPEDFSWAPSQAMPLSLLVGHRDHSARSRIPSRRITRFEAVGPHDKRLDLRSWLQPGADAELRFDGPGTYVIVLATDNQARSDLPADRFNEYLRAEGLTPALAMREQTGHMLAEGSERYSRQAKSIVQVGLSQQQLHVTQPVGLRLEIVPEVSPYAEPRSALLPVRVMYEGQPLAGALVKMSYREDAMLTRVGDLPDDMLSKMGDTPDAATMRITGGQQRVVGDTTDTPKGATTRITDTDGRAVFDMPSHGQWLLHVTWTKPLPASDEADFDTVFASLTFGLPN